MRLLTIRNALACCYEPSVVVMVLMGCLMLLADSKAAVPGILVVSVVWLWVAIIDSHRVNVGGAAGVTMFASGFGWVVVWIAMLCVPHYRIDDLDGVLIVWRWWLHDLLMYVPNAWGMLGESASGDWVIGGMGVRWSGCGVLFLTWLVGVAMGVVGACCGGPSVLVRGIVVLRVLVPAAPVAVVAVECYG